VADEHAARGRYKEALAALAEAIRLTPNDPALFSRQGKLYLQMKQRPPAVAALSKAVELRPNDALYRRQRGWAYYESRKYREAADDLSLATTLDPKSADAYSILGYCYFQLRQYQQAVEALNKATELAPKGGYLYCVRGRSHQALGDHEQARDDYDKAIRVSPDLVEPYRALAALLATSENAAVRDPGRAVECAWKAYEVSKGGDYEALKTLACVHAAVGEPAEAVRWCKQALRLAPAAKRPGLQKLLEEYARRAPPREETRR
jgi:tetratricopeptide (TPR) repeat protein